MIVLWDKRLDWERWGISQSKKSKKQANIWIAEAVLCVAIYNLLPVINLRFPSKQASDLVRQDKAILQNRWWNVILSKTVSSVSSDGIDWVPIVRTKKGGKRDERSTIGDCLKTAQIQMCFPRKITTSFPLQAAKRIFMSCNTNTTFLVVFRASKGTSKLLMQRVRTGLLTACFSVCIPNQKPLVTFLQ